MGNPLWITGNKSANPAGRPKHSVRTVKGMVERFVKNNMTPNKLKKLFGQLTPSQQAEMLMQLLPYTLGKVPTESISPEEVDKLHRMVEETVKKKAWQGA